MSNVDMFSTICKLAGLTYHSDFLQCFRSGLLHLQMVMRYTIKLCASTVYWVATVISLAVNSSICLSVIV